MKEVIKLTKWKKYCNSMSEQYVVSAHIRTYVWVGREVKQTIASWPRDSYD